MLTVYQCITMEGWTKVLYWVSDCLNIVSLVSQFQYWENLCSNHRRLWNLGISFQKRNR